MTQPRGRNYAAKRQVILPWLVPCGAFQHSADIDFRHGALLRAHSA